jgi:hypothetical protein
MPSRLFSVLLVVVLLWSGGLAAQQRVRTETIMPPPATAAPSPPEPAPPASQAAPQLAPPPQRPSFHAVRPETTSSAPVEIITDLSRLPAAVGRMRLRILEAARTGNLNKVLGVMQSGETLPTFSQGNDMNPVTYWKTSYPDSDGIEVLAILSEILETGFVHVDEGTPQEMFVWPYFARVPLTKLTPAQKVELFKIVTGSDYKEMQEFGAYMFYRLGIAPDGTWHYFVAGD